MKQRELLTIKVARNGTQISSPETYYIFKKKSLIELCSPSVSSLIVQSTHRQKTNVLQNPSLVLGNHAQFREIK